MHDAHLPAAAAVTLPILALEPAGLQPRLPRFSSSVSMARKVAQIRSRSLANHFRPLPCADPFHRLSADPSCTLVHWRPGIAQSAYPVSPLALPFGPAGQFWGLTPIRVISSLSVGVKSSTTDLFLLQHVTHDRTLVNAVRQRARRSAEYGRRPVNDPRKVICGNPTTKTCGGDNKPGGWRPGRRADANRWHGASGFRSAHQIQFSDCTSSPTSMLASADSRSLDESDGAEVAGMTTASPTSQASATPSVARPAKWSISAVSPATCIETPMFT